ncbi:MAG: 4-phosphoerythronate dehydrogenase, partial [Bacteroidales bacterium]|nr:4-phosphoerythronate dehydrogenase [Bacteroidales bacterium]
MKIVCDDKIPFLRGVFEPYAEVVYLPGAAITAADVRDADALIVRTRTRCNCALLEGSSVRVIASATIGYDHIDTAWCSEHGIEWANAPGCNSGSVAQYIASALKVLAERFDLDLGNTTFGIVGVGHVGGKVARVAQALGMRVLLNDPPRAAAEGPDGFVSLDDLIAGSDIITLHVPLTSETHHLFDAGRLSQMRPDQILINTSRGEVVDGEALKSALRARRLATAVLDVWEHEPDIDPELAQLVEIATPHIAGYSQDGKAAGTTAAVR